MVAIVTGSAGLIGAEAVRFLAERGFDVVGLDNDMRKEFFGADASTDQSRRDLERKLAGYVHESIDIRDKDAVNAVFGHYGRNIQLVIHTAAQPSHDWAAKKPFVDFSVNAVGTQILLEAARQYSPDAVFIFTSTNKVYGDNPNTLPLVEHETRFELASEHPYAAHGIDEQMSTDHTTHSLFGVSKLAADLLVQEYGRYFGMKTACFRGGCLTGPGHAGTMLHGFLSYLVRCAVIDEPYTVIGYQGKQVRDNIHSFDLVNMFWHFFEDPRSGEVYNAGGGMHAHCSVREAIGRCEQILGRPMRVSYSNQNRKGDHIWYISDVRKFQSHYPKWRYKYDLDDTLNEIFAASAEKATFAQP